jgi:geranylgeranyl pyrophosphate synthase
MINQSQNQIAEMANAALNCYEFTSSWRDAYRAASEHCIDEYGDRCRPSAVKLAVRLAQVQWEARRIAARRI